MPWKERTVMNEREQFVYEATQREESMSALCERYGISRKTGYKWLNRAKAGEPLTDCSKAPTRIPGKTAPEIEELILETRQQHPAWGPRKLLRYLQDRGNERLPSKSTIGNILHRNGCIDPITSLSHHPYKRFVYETPNALWQMDFKGDFLLLDGSRCFPLTVLDDHSRYSLCVKSLPDLRYKTLKPTLTTVFLEYGLPNAILSDNGNPWGDCHGGITNYDVWMMMQGVLPIHGRPLHPQTQGKDERFHRTLKEELLNRKFLKDHSDANASFTNWRYEYNYERPHEALEMDVPAKHYSPSERKYRENPPEPEYSSGTNLRKVNYKGYISINRHRYYLTEALVDKFLRIRYLSDKVVALDYGVFQIACIDLEEHSVLSKRIYKTPST